MEKMLQYHVWPLEKSADVSISATVLRDNLSPHAYCYVWKNV